MPFSWNYPEGAPLARPWDARLLLIGTPPALFAQVKVTNVMVLLPVREKVESGDHGQLLKDFVTLFARLPGPDFKPAL